MRWTVTGTALCVVLLAAACGTDSGRPAGGEGDVPITPAAIAAVALDHLPADPSSMEATYTDRTSPKGYVGADFRYGAGPAEDGNLVRVSLQRHVDRDVCAHAGSGGCVRLDDASDDVETYLVWEEIVPEEDPGYVYVLLRRPHEDVLVLVSGEAIEGDPREQDLRVPVDVMERLARDDRLHLSTTQAVVDAGEDLDDWG